MYKKLLLSLTAVCLLFIAESKAQVPPNPDSLYAHCGFSASYLSTLGVGVDHPNIPVGFPSSAIVECGRFKIYYYDLAYHPGQGFDDPSVGLTRRNTLCSVLAYLQSVYDFSLIPSGEYIRLRVDTSYTHTYHTPDIGTLSWGAPFFKMPKLTGSVINGFVWDYAHTGTDPMPLSFHGDVKVNFDSVRVYPRLSEIYAKPSGIYEVDFQNGLGVVQNCQYDLFTTLLHSCNHVIGHYTQTDVIHGGSWSSTEYSSLDTAVYTGPDPLTSASAFTAPLTKFYPSAVSSGAQWFGNRPAPYRISKYQIFSHFSGDYYTNRFGWGDEQEYVMNIEFIEGVTRRALNKEELWIGKNILNYNFNAGYTSTSPSALYFTNHRPYCNKNFNLKYNRDIFKTYYYFDTLDADFTMVNNIGSSIVINLSADTSLHDDDGDVISIIPESLVNYRGCGQGGNNHKLLSLSNGNKTITFTPRPNFYGRAQFSFSLTDGKEKGAWVIYTIDVAKGTNVSIPAGQNLVLNGDFEEGTEVKLSDTAELVDNTFWSATNHLQMSRVKYGTNFSDCHPLSNGVMIRDSYSECKDNSVVKYGFGEYGASFPWSIDSLAGLGMFLKNPDAYLGVGNRYQNMRFHDFFNLGDSVRKCKNYTLEFDIYRTRKYTDTVVFTGYPAVDTIFVGFTDGSHMIKTAPKDVYMNQNYHLTPYSLSRLYGLIFQYRSRTVMTRHQISFS